MPQKPTQTRAVVVDRHTNVLHECLIGFIGQAASHSQGIDLNWGDLVTFAYGVADVRTHGSVDQRSGV